MFLQEISNDIIGAHGNNLAKVAILFPNKRASLWMNDYLLEAAGNNPVFAPNYFSISEFFQKHSALMLADHIQLVSLLHKSYCRITGESQTLDKFYTWGEILLSDFDNVDKSLADAEQLFRNISSLHELDSIDYLNDEQKELLERFFSSFTRDHESVLQQKFIALWNNLAAIYNDFKNELNGLGIAYEGMLYRDVVERVSHDDFSFDHYYAIGFNQLLKCEEKLFLSIADKLTIKNDEASVATVNPEARITIAQSLTDDLQTRYIESWLKENDRMKAGRRTAIVLCDEHLLPSSIYGLPENAGPVNITAGFPLAETQPASYIATLLEMFTEGLSKDRSHFRASYVRNLNNHPLHSLSSDIPQDVSFTQSSQSILSNLEIAITTIAQSLKKSNRDDAFLQESVFSVYGIITRLKSLNSQGLLDIEPITLARLYKQILQSATIPFHGEPAKGIQIMGVLETRNLDFDHVLMLSCNEGVMPQGASDTSAIPYAVKKAFELNTSDDRTNVFAYYFYRILKRCKDVTLVYNASGSETSPGEMSRFLINLVVNNSKQITRIALQTDFLSKTLRPKAMEKKHEDVSHYIKNRVRQHGISPSAINTYMRCEKSFYYKYIRGLEEERDEDETIDAAAFGTFFHNAAELFYKKFKGNPISSDVLQEYIRHSELLEPFVNKALQETRDSLYGEGAVIESGGMEYLLKDIVKRYLVKLLKNDAKFCPFKIIGLENYHSKRFSVNTVEGDLDLKVGGYVDRLDCVFCGTENEQVRVVDYKTGVDHLQKAKLNTVEDMFDRDKEGSDYYRQACLYSVAVLEGGKQNDRQMAVAPALYYIRNKAVGSNEDTYNPILKLAGKPIDSIAEIKHEFEHCMQKVLHDIFNKPVFDIPEDLSVCSNCPFANLCYE